jgi:hypothetical protein
MYTVIVGNIGLVYTGKSWEVASETYRDYVGLSKRGYGRVAGEPVTILRNGESCLTYAPGTP